MVFLLPPPHIRRTYNILLYAAKTLKNTGNQSNKYLEKSIIETEELQIDLQRLVKLKCQNILSWTMLIDINLDLSEYKKENASPNMLQKIPFL